MKMKRFSKKRPFDLFRIVSLVAALLLATLPLTLAGSSISFITKTKYIWDYDKIAGNGFYVVRQGAKIALSAGQSATLPKGWWGVAAGGQSGDAGDTDCTCGVGSPGRGGYVSGMFEMTDAGTVYAVHAGRSALGHGDDGLGGNAMFLMSGIDAAPTTNANAKNVILVAGGGAGGGDDDSESGGNGGVKNFNASGSAGPTSPTTANPGSWSANGTTVQGSRSAEGSGGGGGWPGGQGKSGGQGSGGQSFGNATDFNFKGIPAAATNGFNVQAALSNVQPPCTDAGRNKTTGGYVELIYLGVMEPPGSNPW